MSQKTPGQIAYERYTDNHPTIHCNRFLPWPELLQLERDQWEVRATEEPASQPKGDPQ